MTRNILPKYDDMKASINKDQSLTNTSITVGQLLLSSSSAASSSSSSSSNTPSPPLAVADNAKKSASSDDDDQYPNKFAVNAPFARTRLNQWHTNEEIFSILTKCNELAGLSPASVITVPHESGSSRLIPASRILAEWLSDEVLQRPNNGSVLLFDRKKVKNFKKDAFVWKRRKTGGANSVREDRMCLKINGIGSIYGCYSHSALISTFHRRCYWLLDKPDLVLVHYLQTPDSETGECVINLNASAIASANSNDNSNTNNGSSSSTSSGTARDESMSQAAGLSKEDLKSEIKAMLWPYYLNQGFIGENVKSLPKATLSKALANKSMQSLTADDFVDMIVSQVFSATSNAADSQQIVTTASPIRVNLMTYLNQSTSDILAKISSGSKSNAEEICPEYLDENDAHSSLSKSETIVAVASMDSDGEHIGTFGEQKSQAKNDSSQQKDKNGSCLVNKSCSEKPTSQSSEVDSKASKASGGVSKDQIVRLSIDFCTTCVNFIRFNHS
jgi:hypothetical protein